MFIRCKGASSETHRIHKIASSIAHIRSHQVSPKHRFLLEVTKSYRGKVTFPWRWLASEQVIYATGEKSTDYIIKTKEHRILLQSIFYRSGTNLWPQTFAQYCGGYSEDQAVRPNVLYLNAFTFRCYQHVMADVFTCIIRCKEFIDWIKRYKIETHYPNRQ